MSVFKVEAGVSMGVEADNEDEAEEKASQYISTRLGPDSILDYEGVTGVEREK